MASCSLRNSNWIVLSMPPTQNISYVRVNSTGALTDRVLTSSMYDVTFYLQRDVSGKYDGRRRQCYREIDYESYSISYIGRINV